MRRTTNRLRLRTAVIVCVLAMLAAACGSDAVDEPSAAAATEQASSSSPDSSTHAESTTDAAGDAASDTAAPAVAEIPPVIVTLAEANWDGLQEWSLPALGGLRFGLPADVTVHHDADMVTLRSGFDKDRGRYEPTMIIALVNRTGADLPVTVQDFTTSAVAGFGTAEPTNTELSLFGEDLAGWRFVADDGTDVGPHYLFQAYPAGTGGLTAWQPFPLAELYLADVPGGVLAVGVTARNESELAIAQDIFDRVAPTLSLDLPLSESAAPVDAFVNDPEPPPSAVSKPEGWPSLLTGLSKPIEPGEYTHAGFGTAFSLTVGDGWWVQPNFPSWLTLSANDSFGPGDRGVTFRSGANGVTPARRGGVIGDTLPFDPTAWLTDPPPNIEVIESGDVNIGGAGGIRIVFTFSESVDCAGGDVCEYLISTRYPFPPASIRTGYHYELWHLVESLDAPVTILSQTPDEAWLPVARDLVDSINFDTDG